MEPVINPFKLTIVNSALYLGILLSFIFLIFGIKNELLEGQLIVSHLVISVGLPLLLSGVFCAALFFEINDKIQLLLFLIFMSFCLYTAEIVLFVRSYYDDFQSNLREAKKEGKPFDARGLNEVIFDLRSQGIRAYPSFMPRQFLYFGNQYPQLIGGLDVGPRKIIPLGGISHATIVACNEGGTWENYQSDEYGFNNPPGLYKQGLEMAALGDSYVEGHCVGPQQNSVAYLRKAGKKALALGKAGDGSLIMLATFREFLGDLKPKKVLWYYYEEDEMDFLGKERNTILTKYLDPAYSQDLKQWQSTIDQKLTLFYDKELLEQRSKSHFGERSLLNYLLISYKNIISLKEVMSLLLYKDDPVAMNLPLFKNILGEIRDRVKTWGGQVEVVYLPSYKRYAKDLSLEEQDGLFDRKEVLNMVKSLNIPIVDIDQVFRKNPDPAAYYIFHRHNHYTSEGYAIIAQAILNAE